MTATAGERPARSGVAIPAVDALMARYRVRATATPAAIATTLALLVLDILSVAVEAALALAIEAGVIVRNQNDGREPYNFLRIGTEFGLWASIGYAKLAAAAGLLAVIARRTAESAYGALAAAFAILLADDALMVHERMGRLLASIIEVPFDVGVAASSLFEVLVFGVIGVAVLALLWTAWRRAGARHRANVAVLSAMVLAVGAFAVAIDFVDQIVDLYSRIGSKALGLIDDGGENMVVSLAVGFLLMVLARERRGSAAQNWAA